MARTLSPEYWSTKPSAEYEAELDDLDLAGFQAGVNGEPPNTKGLFALRRTVYFMGYRKGQAAALVAA